MFSLIKLLLAIVIKVYLTVYCLDHWLVLDEGKYFTENNDIETRTWRTTSNGHILYYGSFDAFCSTVKDRQ
jgi:hypothetical protein